MQMRSQIYFALSVWHQVIYMQPGALPSCRRQLPSQLLVHTVHRLVTSMWSRDLLSVLNAA